MTKTTTPMSLTDASASLRATIAAMSDQFLEREKPIMGIMLALIAGEHVFLGGPPGTAKSAMIGAFAKSVGGTYFERLLMRQSVPEDVFGPTDLLALQQGKHQRKIDGYLPTAEFGFIDECFKANSAILNSLLTLMNERKYDHGATRIDTPLRMLAGASNELPEDDSLAAMWDRFLLRFWVEPIVDDANWSALMLLQGEPEPVKLDQEALAVARAVLDQVDVTPILSNLLLIKQALASELGLVISDRRWRKIVKLIKASAVLRGATVADNVDLKVLAFSAWERPDERAQVFGIVARNSNPLLTQATEFGDAAREIFEGVAPMLRTAGDKPNDMKDIVEARRSLKTIIRELKALILDHSGVVDPDAKAILVQIEDWRRRIVAAVQNNLR